MDKRLKVVGLPNIPDGYTDELTPEYRAWMKRTYPDTYEGLLALEREHHKALGEAEKRAPASSKPKASAKAPQPAKPKPAAATEQAKPSPSPAPAEAGKSDGAEASSAAGGAQPEGGK